MNFDQVRENMKVMKDQVCQNIQVMNDQVCENIRTLETAVNEQLKDLREEQEKQKKEQDEMKKKMERLEELLANSNKCQLPDCTSTSSDKICTSHLTEYISTLTEDTAKYTENVNVTVKKIQNLVGEGESQPTSNRILRSSSRSTN